MTEQTITLAPGQSVRIVAATQPAPTIRRWGVISGDDNAITPANCAAMKAKGVTVITFSAFWERLQGSPQADVRATAEWPQFVARLNAAKGAGLRVSLRIACHYPPQWVLDLVPKYRQADGTTWAGTHGTGDEVRDWIWSAVGQNAWADVTVRVLNGIAGAGLMDVIDNVCLGPGPYGECHYPRPGKWDSPATVTSSFQSAPPSPGPMRDAWYLDSMSRAIVWGIGVIRRAFSGPIFVLHPSFGIRSDWTPASAPYATEFNAGADPRRYIQAYRGLPNVFPYATWLEDTDRATPIAKDSDKASWRKVLDEATLAGLPCWGENAKPDIGAAGMDALFAGPVKAGMAGVNWIHRESWVPLADRWAAKVAVG